MEKKYFEDITNGEASNCQKLSVTRENIIEYGYRYMLGRNSY
jgi:hypothetical protein